MTFRCGQNAFVAGDWNAARTCFERSLGLARRAQASSILAYPLFGLGLLALACGERDAVLRHAEECLAIATQTGDGQMIRAGQSLLAEQELRDGRPGDARVRLQALESNDEGLDLRSTLPALAEACLMLGDMDAAQRYIEDGRRKAVNSHHRVGLVDIQRVQALALIEQHLWDGAVAVLAQALQSARAMPYPYAEARLLHAAGLMHMRRGDHEQARRYLDEARAVFQRLGASWPSHCLPAISVSADPPTA
jgi:tetratricopeptide (TPR) repeat protein